MFETTLAERTAQAARDLAEALSVARPPQTPSLGAPGPQGTPPSQIGPAAPPMQAMPGAMPPGGGGPPGGPTAPPRQPVLPQRPGQSMAMQQLAVRPPTQNPIMGGLTQVKAFAKGGRVSALSVSKKAKGAAKVGTVMHEWGLGKLRSGSKKGPVVTNRKQAIAIGLSEARKAGAKSTSQKDA